MPAPTIDELNDAIAAAALEPLEASGDAGSFKAQPISEMIKARDTKIAIEADAAGSGSAWGRLRPAQVVPPGSI